MVKKIQSCGKKKGSADKCNIASQPIVSNFRELFCAHDNCVLLSCARCNVLTIPNKSINMTNVLMRGLTSLLILFHVISPVDSTRGFVVEGPTCHVASPTALKTLSDYKHYCDYTISRINYPRAEGKGSHG